MAKAILYHFHLSYAAQIARLGLCEAGVEVQSHSLNLLEGEHYEAWYMEINPAGVVPTLVDGDETIAGSLNIVRHAAALTGKMQPPDDAKELMERWIEKHQAVPERELTYGLMPGLGGKLSRGGFPSRIKLLQRLQKKHPQQAEVYAAKIEDLKGWERDCNDPATIQKMEAELDGLFDAFQEHMEGKSWVVGEAYTVADVLWTVLVARMFMMGIGKKITTRPGLLAYLKRAQSRPSFDEAPVYTRVDNSIALPCILRSKLPFLKPLLPLKR